MKTTMLCTLFLSVCLTQAAPASEPARQGVYAAAPIRINCYRGPARATIWDAPMGNFVQDLVEYGYDYANADAIARSICTDETLIGQPERMKLALLEKIRRSPPQYRNLR